MQKIKSFDDLLKTIRTLYSHDAKGSPLSISRCTIDGGVSLSLSTPQERIRFCVACTKTIKVWTGGFCTEFALVFTNDIIRASRKSDQKELRMYRVGMVIMIKPTVFTSYPDPRLRTCTPRFGQTISRDIN